MSETYSEISPSRRFNYRAVAKPNRAASKMQFPFLGMGHRSLIWDLTNKNGDLMGLPLITSCFGGSFCGSFYLGPSSPRISCCKHGSSEGKGWSKSFPSVKLWSCAKSDRPARLWSNRSPKVKVWSVLGHLHGYTPRSLETSSGTDKDWSKSQGTSNRIMSTPNFLKLLFSGFSSPKNPQPSLEMWPSPSRWPSAQPSTPGAAPAAPPPTGPAGSAASGRATWRATRPLGEADGSLCPRSSGPKSAGSWGPQLLWCKKTANRFGKTVCIYIYIFYIYIYILEGPHRLVNG